MGLSGVSRRARMRHGGNDVEGVVSEHRPSAARPSGLLRIRSADRAAHRSVGRAQWVRFDRCYTSDSSCMPSQAALFSGVPGIQNGVMTDGPQGQVLYPHGPTLPGALRAAGVRTGVVSTFGRHPSPWFLVGWDEVHDPTGWGARDFAVSVRASWAAVEPAHGPGEFPAADRRQWGTGTLRPRRGRGRGS